jgi:uroporphyrinogen decarboxylase
MAERMSSQQRVRTAIARQVPDRVPIHDGPWEATVRRWHRQGLPEDKSPADYFGYEIWSCAADLTPRFPVRTLEENEEYVVETTPFGGVQRNHRDYSTTPEIIDTPVKRKEDWPAIKERLKPDLKRIDWASGWSGYQRARAKGLYIVFGAACGYDLMQSYVRSEELLLYMAEDPGFVKEMMDTVSELILQTVLAMHREGFQFDGVWVYNDMGYRNSSLFSPAMYEQIIAPSDRRRNQVFHELGMQTILHSCGRVKGLIPDLIGVGFDCLQPLEVKAGMDLRELKPLYGDRIAFFGGINTMLMEQEDDALIEAEIRDKFQVAKKGGGYIYHSDHSIPLDVSFRKYTFVMECVRRYGAY